MKIKVFCVWCDAECLGM